MTVSRSSTSRLTQALSRISNFVSNAKEIITGSDLGNNEIPHDRGIGQFIKASFIKQHGLSTIAQEYMSTALKSGKGISHTWLAHIPVFFITDPSLIQQLLKFNHNKLSNAETGGVQQRLFGKKAKRKTIIALDSVKEKEEYSIQRGTVMKHLFNPVATFIKPMHSVLNSYLTELGTEKSPIDLENFAGRMAMTMISQIQLGFEKFYDPQRETPLVGEERKAEIAKIVHDVLNLVTSPWTVTMMDMENWCQRKLGVMPPFAWSLAKLDNKGDEIIKKIIKFNEPNVLIKLRSLMNDDKLTVEDLYKPDAIGLIKLFLVGGFETTSKVLLNSMLMLANPKNANFVAKLREEILRLGKKPEDFVREDLENFEYLNAFVYEVLRLWPPFSYMRHTANEDITLVQKPMSASKEEYKEFMNTANRDHGKDYRIPKGSMVIIDVYDAHRDKTLYGEDAADFNPERWLGKKFSLRDVMTRSDFFTFGNDGRACPGRLFSAQEAMLVIARLVMNFALKVNLDFDKPLPYNPGITLELADNTKITGKFEKIPQALEEKEEPRVRFRLELS